MRVLEVVGAAKHLGAASEARHRGVVEGELALCSCVLVVAATHLRLHHSLGSLLEEREEPPEASHLALTPPPHDRDHIDMGHSPHHQH